MSKSFNEENQIYETINADSPLRQGEIVTNITQLVLDLTTLNTETKAFTPIIHPFAIIVSQDCDLDWDFKTKQLSASSENEPSMRRNNKELPSILFCMMVTAQELRLRDQSTTDNPLPKGAKQDINTAVWGDIANNKHERYHFLQKILERQDNLGQGLPELGVDFKRYFSLPSDEVYARIRSGETNRRTKLKSPYLEHFASRFYYFQSRIALPEDHFSE